jgi:hypothetical protein
MAIASRGHCSWYCRRVLIELKTQLINRRCGGRVPTQSLNRDLRHLYQVKHTALSPENCRP